MYKKKQLFLCIIDIILLNISVYCSLFIRNLQLPLMSVFFRHFVEFLPIMVFWVVIQYIMGLYILRNVQKSVFQAMKILATANLSLVFGFMWFYLKAVPFFTPKTILLFFCIIAFTLIFLTRYFLVSVYLRKLVKVKVGVIGFSSTLDEIIDFSNGIYYANYSIETIFSVDNSSTTYRDIPIINSFEAFVKFVVENELTQIIVIDRKYLKYNFNEHLFSLLQHNVSFIPITQFYEQHKRKIPLQEITAEWFLNNIDLSEKKVYSHIKRFLDIVFTVPLFVLTLPLYPILALIIKIESKGPVFFIQKRAGFLGQEFSLVKFRTMRVEGNDLAPTKAYDSRVTYIGNIMRKCRLDEIPQFINVIKGDLSLIGPRPERPDLAEELEKTVPYYVQRQLVRPGISGWDQVSGEYHSPTVEDTMLKLQNDLYYVKNISLALDTSIVARTIRTVFSFNGM